MHKSSYPVFTDWWPETGCNRPHLHLIQTCHQSGPVISAIWVQIGDKFGSSAGVAYCIQFQVINQWIPGNYFGAWMNAGRTKFCGCYMHDNCDFNFNFFIITNEWQCYLTTLKFLRRVPWWWDNHKMRAKKNVADNWLKTFATCSRPCAPKTNVNSTCDVTDLDHIGPISVQDV